LDKRHGPGGSLGLEEGRWRAKLEGDLNLLKEA